jgi:hypothetical protein
LNSPAAWTLVKNQPMTSKSAKRFNIGYSALNRN